MLVAALLAAGSALLGGALALLARSRPTLLELTRTFAFAAAGGVVAFHLLPEALPGLGFSALLWIGAGYALPWLMELAARRLGPGLLEGRGLSGKRIAAEVGFFALVFHSVVEGLALVSALRAPEGRHELEVALVAHHAPLTAAVVLPFLALLGARPAALRVFLIALAGLAGVLAGGAVPALSASADLGALQRATAVTAGILLHVVSDEIRVQRFAARWERAADIAACAAGLALAGLSVVLQLRSAPEAGPMSESLRALVALALASAPALLAGALVSALASALASAPAAPLAPTAAMTASSPPPTPTATTADVGSDSATIAAVAASASAAATAKGRPAARPRPAAHAPQAPVAPPPAPDAPRLPKHI